MARTVFLTHQKAKQMHEASLQVLERTGIRVWKEEAKDLLLKAGAKKDSDERILIPRKMVEEALEKTQSSFNLFYQNAKKSLTVKDGITYFGTGSDALYGRDINTEQLKGSTMDDLRNNVKVADALDGFDFIMSMALPETIALEKSLYPTVFGTMALYTDKPLVITSATIEDVKTIHRIATGIKGNASNLREKPFFLFYLEPISPLKFNNAVVDRLFYCADNELPVIFAAGANCGSGAPITVEGGVAQGAAESLAGLIILKLRNEKTKFVYGANTSSLDMRNSLVCYGAPEWFKTVSMYAGLGKYLKLPSWGTAGCSDAYTMNVQAAMEAYEGILMAVQSGVSMAHDVGYLAHGTVYDSRMLVLTNEMIKRARHLMTPISLSEDKLALNVIDDICKNNSYDGLYLTHPHTSEFFREALYIPPEYLNRRSIEDQLKESLNEMLAEEVKKILDKK